MAGGDRPAVSHPDGGRQAVAAVWRIESARIVSTLARFTGDFALAEDLAQESLAEALVAWPRDGVPRKGCTRRLGAHEAAGADRTPTIASARSPARFPDRSSRRASRLATVRTSWS